MYIKRLILVVCVIGCVFPFSSMAVPTNYSCTGLVATLAIGPQSGILQVNAGHGVHYLCSLKEIVNSVDPAVCKTWYSMFLTAKMTSRKVTQMYDPNAGIAQSCADLGSWKFPDPLPYWVEIK